MSRAHWTLPLRDRVLSRLILDPSGCLLWTGATTKGGYGVVGAERPTRGILYVHRLMYEWFVGPIPDGKQIDHLCRVRHCAAPAHLEAVTLRVNVLRGEGPSAQASRRTHCPQGHPYDAANTYRFRTYRQCRACWPIKKRKKSAAALEKS